MGKDEYPGGEADSFGDRCEGAEHDEGVVERIDFGIPPGESWRSVGVHHSEHVVLGQQVVEPKVLDGDSEFGLWIHDTDLHGSSLLRVRITQRASRVVRRVSHVPAAGYFGHGSRHVGR